LTGGRKKKEKRGKGRLDIRGKARKKEGSAPLIPGGRERGREVRSLPSNRKKKEEGP